jgi:hypothetical protein
VLWIDSDDEGGPPGIVNVTLPMPVNAIGFDMEYIEIHPFGENNLMIDFSDGKTERLGWAAFFPPAGTAGNTFLGVITDDKFKSFSIEMTEDSSILLTHITYGQGISSGNPIPEPTTMLLLGTGLAGLGGMVRKRRRAKVNSIR